MTHRIDKLTSEQQAILPTVRDEWLAHGLSTEPADRAAAEEGVKMAYRFSGLEPPRFMIWMDSPLAGVYAQAVAPGLIARILDPQANDSLVPARKVTRATRSVSDRTWGPIGEEVDEETETGNSQRAFADRVSRSVARQVFLQAPTGNISPREANGAFRQISAQGYGTLDQVLWEAFSSQALNDIGSAVYEQVVNEAEEKMTNQLEDRPDAVLSHNVFKLIRNDIAGQTFGEDVIAQVTEEVAPDLTKRWHARILGQYWAGWYAWIDAMERIGIKGLEAVHGQQQVARSSGWWWCFSDVAILTERPAKLHRDNQGRLHCADRAALLYPDGWGVHAWHGTRVPADLINPGWGLGQILREGNPEYRRCAIERRAEVDGWAAVIREAGWPQVGKTVADPGNPGRVLSLWNIGDLYGVGGALHLLHMVNGTVERDGKRHELGETVPGWIPDPVTAAGWRVRLTAEQYAQTVRRA